MSALEAGAVVSVAANLGLLLHAAGVGERLTLLALCALFALAGWKAHGDRPRNPTGRSHPWHRQQ